MIRISFVLLSRIKYLRTKPQTFLDQIKHFIRFSVELKKRLHVRKESKSMIFKEYMFQDFSNITENITDTIYDYFKVIFNKSYGL